MNRTCNDQSPHLHDIDPAASIRPLIPGHLRMRQLLSAFMLLLLFSGSVVAREKTIPGFLVLENETREVELLLPRYSQKRYLNFERLQTQLDYRDEQGRKHRIKPGDVQEFWFVFQDVPVRMVTVNPKDYPNLRRHTGSGPLFLRQVADGDLRMFAYYSSDSEDFHVTSPTVAAATHHAEAHQTAIQHHTQAHQAATQAHQDAHQSAMQMHLQAHWNAHLPAQSLAQGTSGQQFHHTMLQNRSRLTSRQAPSAKASKSAKAETTQKYMLFLNKQDQDFMTAPTLQFRKILSQYLQDCPEVVEMIQNKEYRKADLMSIVERYNARCSNR